MPSATVFTVNLTTDNSGSPNGTSTGQFSGDLRYCIEQADLPQYAGSTIVFDSKVFDPTKTTTIALSGGELQITQNMIITGVGTGPGHLTINGSDGKGGASRIFDIVSNTAAVSISNMTITGGNAEVFYTSIAGNQGGDIFNGGNLTLSSCIVSNGLSSGTVGGPLGRGGAIFNATGSGATGATLVLDNTIVQTSTAQGSGGDGQGGGIYNDKYATVILKNGSQVVNNKALGSGGSDGQGGGIYNNANAILQLNGNSTTSIVIADNLAQGGAGSRGIDGTSNGASGSGGGRGGNAEGGGVYNSGAFTLDYVNFLGNRAVGGKGGDGGNGHDGANNSKGAGGAGGNGGAAGAGGNAQGGGIYNAVGALTVPDSQFGADAKGVGNQAIGGAGGKGGNAGNGGSGSSGGAGGAGGTAGAGGAAGFAKGGAVANAASSDLIFTNTSFTSSQATGGAGGAGGIGGAGGTAGAAVAPSSSSPGGPGGTGGNGGTGGAGNTGGAAVGGAVFNLNSNLSFTGGTFAGNIATAGAGGSGGNAGSGATGGAGSSQEAAGTGGKGGMGGGGALGGNAQGGGFYNLVGTVTVSGTSFTANAAGIGNEAISGAGGNGGNGGSGGQGGDNSASKGNRQGGNGGAAGKGGAGNNAGFAEGGAGGNQGSDTTLTNVTVTSSLVQSGAGGTGGNGGNGGNSGNGNPNPSLAPYGGAGGDGGAGGNSASAFGGAFAVTASNLTVSGSTFGGGGPNLGNRVLGGAGGAGGIGGAIGTHNHPSTTYVVQSPFGTVNPAGNGGQGGIGAFVYGGALYASGTQTISVTTSTFTANAITAGAGGAGGAAGLFSLRGQNAGINGQGGVGGDAWGGAIYLNTTTAQTATLTSDTITASSAIAGVGGAGAINNLGGTNVDLVRGGNGYGSKGGDGGSVYGIGLADLNYSLTIDSSTFDNGTGTAGAGGVGGGASVAEPKSWDGGAGGNGGTVQGGGIYFSNTASGSLSFTFNGGSASGNRMSGGSGGAGGNAGASGSKSVHGGNGGDGGLAQGGGLYISTGSTSVTNINLSSLLLDNNFIAGGDGGNGGAGALANGGKGGDADGAALYNTSLGSNPSSLSLTASTVAGNHATGAAGGRAGSGTTPNGGAGGKGGDGGSAYGGGLYNGGNTSLTVINSTFGGPSADPNNPNINANVLTGGLGGHGGNAGTPAGVSSNNGGAGGSGGNVAGGNVYIASNTATFINDTLVYGQAVAAGSGNAGGSGAGSGGTDGAPGVNGTGYGGGYFANAGSTNIIGNTIIDLNAAANDGPDVYGAFISMVDPNTNQNAGHNILGSISGSTGFNAAFGDQIGVTAAQLNFGPLQNNGGPTLTVALQSPSVAIDAGNNDLLPVGLSTDQRGTGYKRVIDGTVDIGAFEAPAPPITFSPTKLPTGLVGTAYSQTITGGGGAGNLTAVVTITSTTQPADLGLTITTNGNQVTISGTPTAKGTITFTVTITDKYGNTNSQDYTLTINPAILFTPDTLPDGIVGAAYNQTITANGGSGGVTVQYNLTSGSIPAGVSFTINNNQLTIAGTPTASGTVAFTVIATDSDGDQVTQNYTLTIFQAITLSPTTLPPGIVGKLYNQTIAASGGSGGLELSYNIKSGSIPAGLSFDNTSNPGQLIISGTPTASGTVVFTVTATDSEGHQATQDYTLAISPIITLSPSTLPHGLVGSIYNQTITANGGIGNLTVTYNVTSGPQPAALGLTFDDTSNPGHLVISGAPTASGTVAFTVIATDSDGDQTTQDYTLTIYPAITFSPDTLPVGIVGKEYSQQIITATGGSGGVTLQYALTSGSIPAGMAITPSNTQVTVSGTPTASGTVTFTVTATDSEGDQATHSYTLTIDPAIAFSPNTLPAGIVGTSYSQVITATGGIGNLTVSYTPPSGTIPAGLKFTTTNNQLTIAGTPTESGTITFTVTATDSNGDTLTQNYTLTINPALTFSPNALPPVIVGTAYNQTITANGGSGGVTVQYTLASGSAIPAGLTRLSDFT